MNLADMQVIHRALDHFASTECLAKGPRHIAATRELAARIRKGQWNVTPSITRRGHTDWDYIWPNGDPYVGMRRPSSRRPVK